MAKIKAADMVKMAKYVEGRVTMYWNNFNYYGHPGGNCGLVHADGVQSFDCNNFVKSLINKPGIAYSITAWDYAVPGTVIPDVSEWGLLSLCDDVTWWNFSNCIPAEVLYMTGHIGLFVGSYQDPSGEVNVIEATAAMGGGVLSSWVDSNGYRYDHKGGTCIGRWEAHGKLRKYIEYDEDPSQKIAEDGAFGRDTVTLAQNVLGRDYPLVKTDAKGIMRGQVRDLITRYVPANVSGAWLYEGNGCNTVKAIQQVLRKQGVYSDTIDGIWGRNTSLGLQKFLNKFGYNLGVDGEFGYNSTKAYQNFLNKLV